MDRENWVLGMNGRVDNGYVCIRVCIKREEKRD